MANGMTANGALMQWAQKLFVFFISSHFCCFYTENEDPFAVCTVYVFIYRHTFRKKSIGAVGKIVQQGVAVNLCTYGIVSYQRFSVG